MNFCSHCGQSVQLTTLKNDLLPRYFCTSCQTVHYQNPKIVSGCLVYWENKVLLCRRAIEPRYGFWNLPAGYMENDETVPEGALREVREETNTTVSIHGLHCIYSITTVNQVYILFLSKLNNLNFQATDESSEVKLFTESEIPWNDIAFTSTTFALKRYFQDLKNSTIQTHIGHYPQLE